MATEPKQLSSDFIPGLGSQHEVGASGLGVSVVDCTIAVNTSQTDAQIIASPSNIQGIAGPVVHGLRTAPALVIPMLKNLADGLGLHYNVGLSFITADNSASYIRAQAFTGVLRGVSIRVVHVR